MQSILDMRWPGGDSELSREDGALFRRLIDPASPHYILDRGDYFGFFTYTVHTGRKP